MHRPDGLLPITNENRANLQLCHVSWQAVQSRRATAVVGIPTCRLTHRPH